MIRGQQFRAGEAPAEADLADWATFRDDPSNTFWIDVEQAEPDEIDRLAGIFGLDRRAVDLATRASRQAMVRFFPDHFAVTVVAADVHEAGERPRLTTSELDIFVGKNYLITVHARPLPFARELEERTAANPRLGHFDASYLLYVVLDTLVGHYARELDEIEDAIERLEQSLVRSPGQEALSRLLVMSRHIQQVRRIIGPHREALGALVGADSPIDEQHIEDYFRDMLSRLAAVTERLNGLRDAVAGAYSLYMSTVGHQTNHQLRVLTYLSAVLLPISAIAGLFGTNFKLAAYDGWEPFYWMLGGMTVISIGMLLFFRRRGWL